MTMNKQEFLACSGLQMQTLDFWLEQRWLIPEEAPSGVTFSDLTKLGYLTFALAAGVSIARLLVQIVRFRVITLGLAGDPRPKLSGLALTRVASEFVSLSTPATSMGVFIRTAWLKGKGIDGGKALSIG